MLEDVMRFFKVGGQSLSTKLCLWKTLASSTLFPPMFDFFEMSLIQKITHVLPNKTVLKPQTAL